MATLKELQKIVYEIAKQVGGIANSLGKISEALAEPEIEENFEKIGFKVLGYSTNLKRKLNGKEKEIDLLLNAMRDGTDYVIVMESKVRFRKREEIDEFVEFLSKDFKKFFKEYANYRVVGCVCGLNFGTGVAEYAMKKGLFVMKPKKGIMGIVNPRNFKFKEYE